MPYDFNLKKENNLKEKSNKNLNKKIKDKIKNDSRK